MVLPPLALTLTKNKHYVSGRLRCIFLYRLREEDNLLLPTRLLQNPIVPKALTPSAGGRQCSRGNEAGDCLDEMLTGLAAPIKARERSESRQALEQTRNDSLVSTGGAPIPSKLHSTSILVTLFPFLLT
jgi:hypothetical protein